MATNKERLEKKSADYAAMDDYQRNVSDILKGEHAIKLAAERYLAKYPDETADEYKFRIAYAKFTNIWRDIVEGLSAKPFEREVTFVDVEKVDQRFIDFAEDVTGSGQSLSIFAMEYMFNAVAYSLDYLFVDYPVAPPAPTGVTRSVAEEKALNLRPLWSRISCVNVYEVRNKIINGRLQVVYIRIFEPANGDVPERFREMERSDAGVATFTIWEMDKAANDYVERERGVISIGYVPVVPFFTGRKIGATMQSFPPMKDAADLQLHLYREESNLEITKVYTAYPMLVGSGVKPELDGEGKPKRLVRGPGVALYAPFTGAGNATDWKYIEPAGSSLTFLKDQIVATKQDLRELGKQPLTVSSGNLTVITTAVAAGKAKSSVKTWAIGESDALTMAMWFTALWMGLPDGPKVYVYDEFDTFLGETSDVGTLVSLNSQNKLSDETLWEELGRRGVLSPNFDPEAEREQLLAQVPNLEDNPNNPTPF